MLKKLVIPTAIVTALALTPVLAEQSGDSGSSRADRQQGQMGTDTQDPTAGAAGGTSSATSFDELDRNQDGKLDEEELNVWGSTAAGTSGDKEDSKRGEKMLQRYDQDGDGAISKDEMEEGSMSDTDTDQ